MAPVFAHQGGWDEILLVVAPLAIIGLLLWVANRRLAKQLEEATVSSPIDEASDDQADKIHSVLNEQELGEPE